jgi:hypothetical protein
VTATERLAGWPGQIGPVPETESTAVAGDGLTVTVAFAPAAPAQAVASLTAVTV